MIFSSLVVCRDVPWRSALQHGARRRRLVPSPRSGPGRRPGGGPSRGAAGLVLPQVSVPGPRHGHATDPRDGLYPVAGGGSTPPPLLTPVLITHTIKAPVDGDTHTPAHTHRRLLNVPNQCYMNQLWLRRGASAAGGVARRWGRGQVQVNVNNELHKCVSCVCVISNIDYCVLEMDIMSQWSVPVFTSVLL